MPSNKDPSVVNPGVGKLAAGQVAASAFAFTLPSSSVDTKEMAITVRTADTLAGAPVPSIVLSGSDIFLGNSPSYSIETLYGVVDDQDRSIYNAGTKVVVASIIGGTVGAGFSAGAVTLTLNVSIPAGVTYRVVYHVRSTVGTLPVDAFTIDRVYGLNAEQTAYAGSPNWATGSPLVAATVEAAVDEVVGDLGATGGGAKVGVDNTSFAGALTLTGGGGITAVTDIQASLGDLDDEVVARRSWTAVVTDGTTSVGGDFQNTNISDLFTGTWGDGAYFFRRGDYFTPTPNNTYAFHFRGEDQSGKPELDLTAASSVVAGGPSTAVFSTIENFEIKATGDLAAFWNLESIRVKSCWINAGAAAFNGLFALEDSYVVSSTKTNAWSLQFTGLASGYARKVTVGVIPTGTGGAANGMRFANLVPSSEYSSILIDACTLETLSGYGASATHLCELTNSTTQVVFRGCTFRITSNNTGAVNISDADNITFEDCTFESTGNATLISTQSCQNVVFRKCRFVTPDITGTVIRVLAEDGDPVVMQDCTIHLTGGATGTAFSLEFGTTNGTPTGDGSIILDNVKVFVDSAATGLHDQFFRFHGTGSGSAAKNISFDLASKAGATSNGRYINFENVDVTGLYVDNAIGNSSNTGAATVYLDRSTVSGGVFDGSGGTVSTDAIYADNFSVVQRMHMLPSDGNYNGYLFRVDTGSTVDSCRSQVSDQPNYLVQGWFAQMVGNYSLVTNCKSDFRGGSSGPVLSSFIHITATLGARVIGNYFSSFSTGGAGTVTNFVSGGAARAIVSHNYLQAGNSSGFTAIDLGAASVAVGNIVDSQTTATITATNTAANEPAA